MTQQEIIDSGAAAVRWDLTDLYTDLDDPGLESDLQALLTDMQAFHTKFAGNLATLLGEALDARAEMVCRSDQLMVYLFLRKSTDATNQHIQQRLGQVQEALSEAGANYLTFFEHEVCALSDDAYASLRESDARVERHRSMLDHMRENMAALFLRRFASDTRYAHFDIYGWNPTPAPGRPKGGVGMGARALLQALPQALDL